MDLKDTKNELEIYKKTLENSVKMYETTLNEMIERGADKNAVNSVMKMKTDTEQQIQDINDSLENIDDTGTKTYQPFSNHIVDELFKSFKPFFKHRFIVDFGTDDIKGYYVVRVNYTNEHLNIVFRDSEEFFTPKYLSKNKHFDTVKVYLVSPLGEKKTTIEFRNVNLETFKQDALSYNRDEDEVLTTDVVFKFDCVKYE